VEAMWQCVREKALLRLKFDGVELPQDASPEQEEAAIDQLAYYKCFKCKQPYFGGNNVCAAANNDVKEAELVCSGCSDESGATTCPEHGSDFVEFKCRFCCSVATFFCFGTTHFCSACHANSLELTSMAKANLVQCPCRSKGLSGLPEPITSPPQLKGQAQSQNQAQSQDNQDAAEAKEEPPAEQAEPPAGEQQQQQQQQQPSASAPAGPSTATATVKREPGQPHPWCPLGVAHPPSGEEFCLGCAVCRNRQRELEKMKR